MVVVVIAFPSLTFCYRYTFHTMVFFFILLSMQVKLSFFFFTVNYTALLVSHAICIYVYVCV